jgi:hypothetical protein
LWSQASPARKGFRGGGAGEMAAMEGDGRRHEHQARIFLRPVGSGLPLGFFSFGIGMLLLGCLAVGWIPVEEQKDVGMILIAFVFPLELLATVFAFLARDTLGATTLGLFTRRGLRSAGSTSRRSRARRASRSASTSSGSRPPCCCSP